MRDSDKIAIQEMTRIMCKPPSPFATDTPGDIFNGCYLAVMFAEKLYLAGYRKQSEGEWISVEERLPDGSGKFLVVDEEGYITTATWYPNHGWFMAVCNGTPVTHWMPLPEPPVTKGA